MYYLYKFENEASLRSAIAKYINFYNSERLQERFGNQTPMEVRKKALNATEPAQYPIRKNKCILQYKAKFVA